MASITGWTRLEPRVRREDPAVGLEAKLHDPLWLLARQWQVGEFTAEDAGSPLQVRVRIERSPLTRYLPGPLADGGGSGRPYDATRLPLEALVEREPTGPDLRFACEAGLHFLRLLERFEAGKYREAYAQAYPIARDDAGSIAGETARLVRVAAGRVPDGLRLAADLRSTEGTLPAAPLIEPADQEAVRAAADQWLGWLNARFSVPPEGDPSPWNAERMEYAFALAGPSQDGERVLVAREYAHGHLDWHAFDQVPGAVLGAAGDAAARESLVRTAIPSPVSYRGMPVSRWWEFEDGQVNFGAVDAGPTDLLRLLLLGFALDYGNDWFLLPVELPAGGIYRITSLVVTDSFGERTLLRPYTEIQPAGSHWRMFNLTAEGNSDSAVDDLLFLPPAVPPGLHGEPLEEVMFLRDEVANLGWAVERRVQEAGGRPLDRFEQYQRARAAAPEPQTASENGELRYRLSTTVPDYWIPLVPARPDPDDPGIRLVRGRVLIHGSTTPVSPPPLGRLLEPGRPLRLFEEEVTRAGARVTRAYQYVRWTDGSSHLWIGRQKSAGRGEGASGLRFDSVS
ncbi:MAG: hypothetical protein ACREM1_01335 [Longimicrobiales bacterium]